MRVNTALHKVHHQTTDLKAVSLRECMYIAFIGVTVSDSGLVCCALVTSF